jgi:hypothetical protein
MSTVILRLDVDRANGCARKNKQTEQEVIEFRDKSVTTMDGTAMLYLALRSRDHE